MKLLLLFFPFYINNLLHITQLVSIQPGYILPYWEAATGLDFSRTSLAPLEGEQHH